MTTSALSLNEQWLWLVEQLTEGSVARTSATLGRRVRGDLDLDRLREAVTELIRRHETLRTTFVVQDGRLRRVVSADTEPDWIVVDLTGEPGSDQERADRAADLMDLERTKQIDITRGRQTRCWIARVSPTEHFLLFATHHLAADAASLVLMEEELSGLYSGGGAGDRAPAASSPPYSEFVQTQGEALGGRAAKAVDYWADLIHDARALDLDLLFGRPTTAPEGGYSMTVVPKGIAEREQVDLGAEASEAVHRLMRERRCSLFMVLLTALQLTIHLRSGGQEFLVRSPSANRGRPGHRHLIGAVETQTFVRAEMAPDQPLADLLERVRAQVLTGLRHQEVPMGVILGAELARGRSASASLALGGGVVQFGLFAHGRMADWSGLDVVVCGGSRIGTASDLQVFAMEEGGRLDGAQPGIVLEANDPGGAYGPARVQEFLHLFRDVVACLAHDPTVTVADLCARFGTPDGADRSDDVDAPASTDPAAPPADERDAHALEAWLLPMARRVTQDDELRPDGSLFRDAPSALAIAVSLVDAVNEAAAGTVRLTLVDLLERPTVRALSRSLAARADHG